MISTLDLHCHLRGTMSPSLAGQLAKKHQLKLPALFSAEGYEFTGFDEFLSIYDQIGHVIRTPDDLREVAYRYLANVAKCGTKYVEFMISPGHSIENGIPFSSQISSISEAIEQARDECGIICCIIVTCVRHRGPDEAVEVAELAAKSDSPYVRGFGLTGNEHVYNIEEFKPAFLIAESARLGLTAHVGEWLPAETVLKAVDYLGLRRVGHGITAAADPYVLAELIDRNIGFEICLSSNVKLGAVEAFEQHPFRIMIDAGCRVNLSTDDPAYFMTSPKNETELARHYLNVTEDERLAMLDHSIEMAFCSEEDKSYIRIHAI